MGFKDTFTPFCPLRAVSCLSPPRREGDIAKHYRDGSKIAFPTFPRPAVGSPSIGKVDRSEIPAYAGALGPMAVSLEPRFSRFC